MVVDDLQDLGLIEAFHGLCGLVVIHQNDAALAQRNHVPAADHAAVLALLVEDGEIAVAHLGHDPHHVRHRGDEGELHDIVAGHIIGDGGALAHQLARGVGIAGGRHDGDAHFLGNAPDSVAHLGAVAEDEEGGLLLNGAELAFVAVGQDDDVALFHVAFQHFGGSSADLDVAGGADGVLVAHHHRAAQRFKNVLVAGLAAGKDAGIKDVHVGGGDVLHCDDALQLIVGAGDGQSVDLLVAHDLPRLAQAGGAGDAGHFAVIHIPDLGVDVGAHPGRRDAELFQDELGFLIHLPRAAGFADEVGGLIFQLRIRNGGADRVGVRVAVPDDHDFVGFLWHRCFPSLWIVSFTFSLLRRAQKSGSILTHPTAVVKAPKPTLSLKNPQGSGIQRLHCRRFSLLLDTPAQNRYARGNKT